MGKKSPKFKLDLVLHPVRMRIIMALASEKQMTAQQLAAILTDVPQATLYRHINRLADASLIEICEERQVRGTLEKVYCINQGANLTAEELAQFGKEDHMRFFTAFVATLLDDFSRYLQRREQVDFLADGVGYQKFPLNLSDEELRQLSLAMNAVLRPYLDNRLEGERQRRIFTTIVMPDTADRNPGRPASENTERS